MFLRGGREPSFGASLLARMRCEDWCTWPGHTTGMNHVRNGRQGACTEPGSWRPYRANPRPLKGNSDSPLCDRRCVIWTPTTLNLTFLPRSVLDCQTDPLLKLHFVVRSCVIKNTLADLCPHVLEGGLGAWSPWVSVWLLGRRVGGGGWKFHSTSWPTI